MKIYNLTFIVDPVREPEFLKWLAGQLATPGLAECAVLKVAEVPGDPEFGNQAVSISLQKRCLTDTEINGFRTGHAEHLSEEYARWAGGEGLTFATILEELTLG